MGENNMTINLINYALAKKDWEKAYEDLKVLGIGWRNLLLDSTFNEGNWTKNQYMTILPPEPDKPNSSILRLYHVNDTGNTNVNHAIWNRDRIYLEPREGDKITFSFDFYCEDSSVAPAGFISTFRRFIDKTGGSHVQSLFNGNMNDHGIGGNYGRWVRAKYTYTFTSDTAVAGWYGFGAYVSNSVSSGSSETRVADYKYREIKIEHGDKATDWTPAPEDINAHPFVAELAETVFRSKQNEERIRNLENALTALGGGS